MNYARLFLQASSFALLALAGCSSAPPSDQTVSSSANQAFTGTFKNVSWEDAITCDGGAMTIQVNANERREIRVLVHDVGIARWVSNGQYDSTYKSSTCGSQYAFAEDPCVEQDGTLGLPGTTEHGVFHPDEFSWMRGTAQLQDADRAVDFTAWRDGSGAIHLEKMSDRTAGDNCDSNGNCQTYYSPAPKITYADWVFHDCQ